MKRRQKTTLDYRVTLECGCVVNRRTQPLRANERMMCTSGQAHGYQLRWVRWDRVDGGFEVNDGRR